MKRFTDTNIWDEDWFITMPPAYRLLWIWIKDKCDHSGIWKPNLKTFENLNGTVDLEKAVEYFNTLDKVRIIKLTNGKFFLPGFFVFQYGATLNLNNNVHASALKILNSNGLSELDFRGLLEVKQSSNRGQTGVKETPKDKEKDKDKDIISSKENVNNNLQAKNNKKPKPEKTVVEKAKFADLVTMTNEEHSKLIAKHGEKFTQLCISELDNYKGANGKTYEDDYRAILSWVVDKVKKKYPNIGIATKLNPANY